MTDISGWKVVGWRYHSRGKWACFLVLPNGSRYEPATVGGGYVTKAYGQSEFVVDGHSESSAKQHLRDFMIGVQRDRDLAAREPEDFAFDETKDFLATRKIKTTSMPNFGAGESSIQDTPSLDQRIAELREKTAALRATMQDPPDTSWVQTEDIRKSGRKSGERKSLWQEWKDKRAEKKNQRTEQQDSDSSGSGRATEG